MIGLVIVAHGALADAFLAAMEHVVGPQPHAAAIPIQPNDDLRERQAAINAAVDRVNQGSGVIIVTDMFGGTPSNLALVASAEGGVEVVYGASLPLLVKLAKLRSGPMQAAIDGAIEAGHKYLDCASAILDPSARRA